MHLLQVCVEPELVLVHLLQVCVYQNIVLVHLLQVCVVPEHYVGAFTAGLCRTRPLCWCIYCRSVSTRTLCWYIYWRSVSYQNVVLMHLLQVCVVPEHCVGAFSAGLCRTRTLC